jgi:putative tributyrin esterase
MRSMSSLNRSRRVLRSDEPAAIRNDPLDRIRVITVESKQLKQRRNVLVYLPPDYCHTARHYPILYLLHGGCGTELDWFLRGRVHTTLDRLILAGRIQPLVVAMPNDGLYTGGTFFTRWYDGTGDFERLFLKEIVPAVESQVRARAERSCRAIAGLSMGGYAALTLSLRHPRLFCAAASLSGMTMPASPAVWGRWARRIFGPLTGRGAEYRRQRDPRCLVTRRVNRSVALHLNCGEQDFLRQMNRKFHNLMDRLGRPHEYMEFKGTHDWKYWSKHIEDALVFVDKHLHTKAPAAE